MTTEITPEKCPPDTCPKCGSKYKTSTVFDGCHLHYYKCDTIYNRNELNSRTPLCRALERAQKAEAELKLQTGRVAVLLGTIKERDLLKSENAKLRGIADRLIQYIRDSDNDYTADVFRAEYEQLTRNDNE